MRTRSEEFVPSNLRRSGNLPVKRYVQKRGPMVCANEQLPFFSFWEVFGSRLFEIVGIFGDTCNCHLFDHILGEHWRTLTSAGSVELRA